LAVLIKGKYRPSYWHDLEAFFWSLCYIIFHYRGGVLIDSNITPDWHQGTLAQMRCRKSYMLDDFSRNHANEVVEFSKSLAVSHCALLDFIAFWAGELKMCRVNCTEPPSFEVVCERLEKAIDVHRAQPPTS
jgi:hypothetical protein